MSYLVTTHLMYYFTIYLNECYKNGLSYFTYNFKIEPWDVSSHNALGRRDRCFSPQLFEDANEKATPVIIVIFITWRRRGEARSTEDVKPGRGCNICFKRVTRRAIISNVDATGAVMARGLRFRGNGQSCKFNTASMRQRWFPIFLSSNHNEI